jgi:thiol-disulfide isomerase/thioredoxin
MNMLIIDSDNQQTLQDFLAEDRFVVACLCADWCDTCKAYQRKFAELSAQHPEQRFVWIDIEDNANLVGDLDISNFPTLLIQHQDTVAFFGTVLPDARQADRLLRAQMEKSLEELIAESRSSEEKQSWQRDCNLRVCLENA